jgi:hypothetical protein
MDTSFSKLKTQAPSHSFSTGHTFAHPAPMMLEENIVRAEPLILPKEICLMNSGTSIPAGHNFVQGASQQLMLRFASMMAASSFAKGGWMSVKASLYATVSSRLVVIAMVGGI